MTRFQAPRGTEDRLPAQQPWWSFVESAARDIAALYGFQRIDTPLLEPTPLFVRGVGQATDIVDKEMYTFADRGGDSLTLRPEGTAPICRAYIEHGMQAWPQPVKLWYWIAAFRYDRPQAGRYRQFHQFGYEVFGETSPEVDVEVIDMALAFYERVGLTELDLLINSIGSADSRRRYVAALRAYYEPLRERLSRDSQARLDRNPLRILDSKDPRDQPFATGAPRILDFLDDADATHFAALRAGLDDLGIAYRVDHRLVRGLDYYVRTVFEVQPPDQGSQSALGGGGRYDLLMEALGGPPTPGTGFATGIERIIANLERSGRRPPQVSPPPVYVAAVGLAARQRLPRLARDLRRAGVATALSYGDRSLKAQLRHAGQLGARVVVILGDDEVARGVAAVKDMAGGEQRDVPLDQLVATLGGARR